MQSIIDVCSGTGGIFTTDATITVIINAKDSLAIVGISFLLNPGANCIKPKNLAKIIMPAPRARFISGNNFAN
jgi:hypothetical protein